MGEAPKSDAEWLTGLTASGRERDNAIAHLHALLVKAAAHQAHRMGGAERLGVARLNEVITSAANEAAVAVLAKLDTFEGRSRFTTWVFKFGILHANVEMRRLMWRGREVEIDDTLGDSLTADSDGTPEAVSEANDMQRLVQRGMGEALTAHQRKIAQALLIDEVPIDVLAERLGTNRGALYKTLHEARKRLRGFLIEAGALDSMGAGTTTIFEGSVNHD